MKWDNHEKVGQKILKEEKNMKILIAVPCMDTLPVPFVSSLYAMDKPEGTDICFKTGSLVYDARNLLCLKAINEKYDYVLWLDSDMTFQNDLLMNLMKDLDYPHIQMVSGLYVKRTYPTVPVVYKTIKPPTKDPSGNVIMNLREFVDYPEDSLFCIDGCGFGCVLMSTDLIKNVWDTFGPAFSPLPWCGEDVSFCYRVNQLTEHKRYSGHIWCDSRIKCGHIGTFLFTDQMLKRGEKHD